MEQSNTKEEFNAAYKQGVPWTYTKPSKELIDLVKSGKVSPCKTLEVGCGEGYNSIYLASVGFQVTSIDWSDVAIQLSKQHAKEADVLMRLLQLNIADLDNMKEEFGFIFDWRFFHDIVDPAKREKYVLSVKNLLAKGGKYLSVSFSEKSTLFGLGKIRRNPRFGIDVYFASMKELEKLFSKYFKIIEKKEIILPERKDRSNTPVIANYFFMKKT